MVKSRLLATVGIVAVVGAVLTAQTLTSPAFGVASVKLNKLDSPQYSTVFQPGGRFVATATLQMLIAYAHGIPGARASQAILDGPDWLTADVFDVEAKTAVDWPPGRPTAEMFAMLQGLLGDRFKLSAHHDSREVATYALVVARPDGTLGPQLRMTSPDCVTWMAARGRGPVAAPSDPTCGRMGIRTGGFVGSAVTMPQLATLLGGQVGRIVQDRTSLTGSFDINLTWGPMADAAVSAASELSIFTALQEQLGLKLDPRKDLIDVVVIDHVERPIAN